MKILINKKYENSNAKLIFKLVENKILIKLIQSNFYSEFSKQYKKSSLSKDMHRHNFLFKYDNHIVLYLSRINFLNHYDTCEFHSDIIKYIRMSNIRQDSESEYYLEFTLNKAGLAYEE